jgi:hypothetical protein
MLLRISMAENLEVSLRTFNTRILTENQPGVQPRTARKDAVSGTVLLPPPLRSACRP